MEKAPKNFSFHNFISKISLYIGIEFIFLKNDYYNFAFSLTSESKIKCNLSVEEDLTRIHANHRKILTNYKKQVIS